jgi:uncharacterized protein (TIGR02453 family)
VVFAFGPDTLAFLGELREHNDRAWFDAHRADYQAAYVEPAKDFVEAAAPILRRLVPAVHAEPRVLGSIFRINRDTRFSKDKRPYKDHLDFWFWEGERRAAQSGFYLRVTPDLVGIGAGAHHFDRDALDRFRTAVADPASGARLAEIAAGIERDGLQIGNERYKRPPRGFDADGPAAGFLLHDGLFVATQEPPEIATDPARLMPACEAVWTRLAPLHRWLVDHVQLTGRV